MCWRSRTKGHAELLGNTIRHRRLSMQKQNTARSKHTTTKKCAELFAQTAQDRRHHCHLPISATRRACWTPSGCPAERPILIHAEPDTSQNDQRRSKDRSAAKSASATTSAGRIAYSLTQSQPLSFLTAIQAGLDEFASVCRIIRASRTSASARSAQGPTLQYRPVQREILELTASPSRRLTCPNPRAGRRLSDSDGRQGKLATSGSTLWATFQTSAC